MQNQIQEILKEFELNPLAWGMVYCNHHFRSSSPPFHLKIIKVSKESRFIAIAAPRESAKSTIVSFLIPTHSICFKKRRFMVIVQNTYKKAAGTLETIKREFKDNEKIKKAYGITITKDSEGDTIFRHPDGFETRVLCKGSEQIGSIRGEKFGAYRPDLFIVDDLEDDEMVRNPDRRRELQQLFDEALVPAGDRELCTFLVIGTILHDDSLMAKLVSKDYYKEYRKLLYRAKWKDSQGNWSSLWPEKWTLAQLEILEKDKPEVFAKEYQNDPVSGVMSKFKREDFRYWRIENMHYILFGPEGEVVSKGSLMDCKAAIACDLAWEEKRESDFSVIMPGYLTPQSDLLIDDYIFKKGLRPDEMEEILFTMEKRLRDITGQSIPIGFEKAKLEKVMKWLLKEAMRKRNKYLWFKDLQWDGDKIQRIVTRLQPRYSQHVIYHKKNMGDLENQLLRVPSGTHDDLADAAQGLVQLLEYPRGKSKPQQKSADPEFDWWRKQAIDAKKPKKSHFIYGNKGKNGFEIPHIVSFR